MGNLLEYLEGAEDEVSYGLEGLKIMFYGEIS